MPGDDRAEGLAVCRKAPIFAALSCEGTACLKFCSSQRCREFSRGRDPPAQLRAGRVPAAILSLLLESFLPLLLCTSVQPPPAVTLFYSDGSKFLVGRGG